MRGDVIRCTVMQRCDVMVLVWLLLVSSARGQTGERCQFSSSPPQYGRCEELGECLGRGMAARANAACPSGLSGVVLACCRRTPRQIAEQKCGAWRAEGRRWGVGCGQVVTRIHSGEEALLGEYPHMAAIHMIRDRRTRNLAVCGGSLISPSFVLTAAHCLEGGHITHVRVGATTLSDDQGAVMVVKTMHQHPHYDHTTSYHDLALLELLQPVELNNLVLPACLPHQDTRLTPATPLTVAGWGKTERAETSGVLLRGSVRTVGSVACGRQVGRAAADTRQEYPVGITDALLCVDESRAGACQGDSGGPLMEQVSGTCQYVVHGTVSRGTPSCTRANPVPGIYTSTQHYLDWLVAVVWPEE